MSRKNHKTDRSPTDTLHSALADRQRLGETSLRLVTVASEQRRADDLRNRVRAAYRADRERRLLAVFGAGPVPTEPDRRN